VAIEWESADSAPAAVPEPDDDALELLDVEALAAEGAPEELLDDPQPPTKSATPIAQAAQSLCVESMRPDWQPDLTFS
jgi:hypothetical protein